MKRILFIDRDGTLIKEAPPSYQIDSFEKLVFYPHVFEWMGRIAREFDYELVMVTNQDGLGTEAFPLATFQPVQDFVLESFKHEDVVFSAVHIDRTFAKDNAPTRKPNTGMLTEYIDNPAYDIKNSYVIGDRITDVQLAKNLGCKAIWLNNDPGLGAAEVNDDMAALRAVTALESPHWADIYSYFRLGLRQVTHERNTAETRIAVTLNIDGSGKSDIHTGIGFFDHMLDQIARHGRLDLAIKVAGDLHIDEHHTIEDTGIALGEAFALALADKRGMERYGFALPMDDADARVLIDFGGRSWIVWDAEFKREKIGEMPTEMFFHFFKSFSDAARCNLNVVCRGDNEHHKIEAIFKALARAIRMAVRRDPLSNHLPSTKGML
ncbi:MAG TPA: bifunctional histidinol-phosphatase/imidazoleglycerol-phosphate dehydratase HisB [Dinghuibacter sp.]|uniref:bifunctional histidinol-phosphatase/imidazoleglycerol-phosphate dehydratase HisB n=1 Tax=Dinghuibacter sp. TaxID=2024697 RepID=UPI002C4DE3A3|nr:bifunctional histidinol-phosphatase/imidazoleglycerol-phosphate dehydratase HisB [Dinghuibacter sp.]HTJ13753.1 bifunctional histidinol-phosphatase/imidazoleglycerol-phosphate dehydratase HisB [Dinghuibacter sp.]